MKHAREEPFCNAERVRNLTQVIDLVSAVNELHGFSSQELNKLLRDSENFSVHCYNKNGSPIKVDVERLASFLPLHLISVLISSDRDEETFRYVLCGVRLLHSLLDIASKHAKLEQILLDDVKISEQLLDLVFYLLVILGHHKKDYHNSSPILMLHSTLVACSLYMLTGFVSSQWQDLALVLLAHPKVDIFMDATFGAIHVTIMFLQLKLSEQQTDVCLHPNEQVVNYICLQCEASLQFLQSLCQQKTFRERLLRNKELCGKGGVLFLAQSILKLSIAPPFFESSTVVASVSRLKAKVLSILLHLCEAESISYLDEVANSPGSLDLAKSVALEVFELLRTALIKDPELIGSCPNRTLPMGLLQLNAMRLADIFSDDSNFRSYITTCFTEVLSAIFSLSHRDFLFIWCSSEFPIREEDATVEYDIFAAAGWALDTVPLLSATKVEIISSMPQASYAHNRTSLFVKVIANLHCFIPNICEEQERNLFLKKFLGCLQMDPSKVLPGFSFTSGPKKVSTVCRNLRSLLSHAESLTPIFLIEEDVTLLRIFFQQLESSIDSYEIEGDRVQQIQIQESKNEESVSCEKFSKLNLSEHLQEAQSTRGCQSPLQRKEPPNLLNTANGGDLREEMSENSAFQEERFEGKSNLIYQIDDMMRQDTREDKDKLGVLGSSREIDKDVQIVGSSGSDASPPGVKNFVDQADNIQFPKLSEPIKESVFRGVQEEDKVETFQSEEKQQRKRKRTIMNDCQMGVIERALLEEPDMQRNTSSIRYWASRLSLHGSEVTSSQLKNWLNNRKARLARASKDARPSLEVDNSFPRKQSGQGLRQSQDSPDSPGEDHLPSNSRSTRSTSRSGAGNLEAFTDLVDIGISEFVPSKPDQLFVLRGGQGEEIGTGRVHQETGKWAGTNLEESGTCVVDVIELKADRWAPIPHPSEAVGSSFGEAEAKLGVMRVMWDTNKMYLLMTQKK